MKQKLTPLDLHTIITPLKESLKDQPRLQNIYDNANNARTITLKFHTMEILIESGIRIHPTTFVSERNKIPGGFVMKLRKHLRNRKLVGVKQNGFDRIVTFDFGDYLLVCEFFAAGNIILTTATGEIMTLLRVIQETRVHKSYDFEAARPPFTSLKDVEQIINLMKDKNGMIKKVLGTTTDYGRDGISIALSRAKLDPNMRVDELDKESQALKLFDAILEVDQEIQTLPGKGYLVKASESESHFIDFYPIHPSHLQEATLVVKDTFLEAVDLYFSSLVASRAINAHQTVQTNAEKKLEHTKSEQQTRINALKDAMDEDVQKAEAIMRQEQDVQEVCDFFSSVTNWREVEGAVQRGDIRGITKIDRTGKVWIDLSDVEDEADLEDNGNSDEDDTHVPYNKDRGKIHIELDFKISAYANARNYYDRKKQLAQKHEKTIAASTQAIRNAEKKIAQSLHKVIAPQISIQKRVPFAFEKTNWSFSSQGLLMLSPRDPLQLEGLITSMIATDILVHSTNDRAVEYIIKVPPSDEGEHKTDADLGILYGRSIAEAVALSTFACGGPAWFALGGDISWNNGITIVRRTNLMPDRMGIGIGIIWLTDKHADILSKMVAVAPIVKEEEAPVQDESNEETMTDNIGRSDCAEEVTALNAKEDTQMQRNSVSASVTPHSDSAGNGDMQAGTTAKPLDTPAVLKNDTNNASSDEDELEEVINELATPSIEQSTAPDNRGQLARGKRSKAKRTRKKYKDQDEDEKAIRMQVLGIATPKHELRPLPAVTQLRDRQVSERPIRKVITKTTEELSAENKDLHTLVRLAWNSFALAPKPDDTVSYAIPCLGAMHFINKCSLKLKISPGLVKKGKAARSAMEHFAKIAETDIQRELIRFVPEPESINVIPGKVKFSSGVGDKKTPRKK